MKQPMIQGIACESCHRETATEIVHMPADPFTGAMPATFWLGAECAAFASSLVSAS